MEQNNKKTVKERISNGGKKATGFIHEFQTFIKKGNVIDLAVAVVMGTAFNAIVTSLVNDIIMPLIGVIIGGVDLTGLTLNVKDATINYGIFLQNIINFLIIAFSIFLVIKVMNKFLHKKEEEPKPVVKVKSDETLLLEEIRDLLKKNK